MRRPIASLRKDIAKVRIDSAGRRRYDKELRRRLVHFTRAEQSRGRPIVKVAEELGIREQVLGGWLRKAGRPTPIRQVEVVEEKTEAQPAPSELRLRLPGGAVVEGPSLADVSTRALRFGKGPLFSKIALDEVAIATAAAAASEGREHGACQVRKGCTSVHARQHRGESSWRG